MKNYFLGAVLALCATSCANSSSQDAHRLVGSWQQSIPGQSGVQGFTLEADGSATSINMATLQYTAWCLNDDKLTLKGQSIGNGQSFDFADMFYVTLLTDDSLHLTRGDLTIKYERAKW